MSARRPDVIIIGAGIVGAACADSLTWRGRRNEPGHRFREHRPRLANVVPKSGL